MESKGVLTMCHSTQRYVFGLYNLFNIDSTSKIHEADLLTPAQVEISRVHDQHSMLFLIRYACQGHIDLLKSWFGQAVITQNRAQAAFFFH